jgi:hypothetical protein
LTLSVIEWFQTRFRNDDTNFCPFQETNPGHQAYSQSLYWGSYTGSYVPAAAEFKWRDCEKNKCEKVSKCKILTEMTGAYIIQCLNQFKLTKTEMKSDRPLFCVILFIYIYTLRDKHFLWDLVCFLWRLSISSTAVWYNVWILTKVWVVVADLQIVVALAMKVASADSYQVLGG